MPAIRGIYYNHPQTGEPGLWIWTAWGDNRIVGRSQTQLEALRPTTGSPASRLATMRQRFKDAFQLELEQRTPLSNWTMEEQAMPVEEDCYVDGTDYVAQMCLVDFEVISLNPLRYQVTVKDGASSSQTKWS